MGFEPGSIIAGKYRVERVIGQGGMGVVLAARHLGLDEMVAVKLIREERTQGVGALARFQREARAAARIKSEHVARVLDVDRLPEGEPYIVMELIDGTDLHALLKRRGTLPPADAVTYIVQACEGLAEAHALGMVHRDLKLKNLFLTKRRDGRPLIKVIDFGVVKLTPLGDDDDVTSDDDDVTSDDEPLLARAAAREHTLTNTATLVGSVHYMAPEQIRASHVVDAKADVWSLGVCLHTMLTGQLPFHGDTIAAVCAAIQGRPAPDVRERAPHVSAELAAVVTRALEKDVRRRFASVAELATALGAHGKDSGAALRIETILSSNVRPRDLPEGQLSEPKVGATATLDAPLHGRIESTIDAAAMISRSTRSPAPRTPARGRWIVGAVLAMAGVGGTLAMRGGSSKAPPAAASGIEGASSVAALGAMSVVPASALAPPPALADAAPTASGTAAAVVPAAESSHANAAAASPPANAITASGPAAKSAPRSPARQPKPTPPSDARPTEPASPYDHF